MVVVFTLVYDVLWCLWWFPVVVFMVTVMLKMEKMPITMPLPPTMMMAAAMAERKMAVVVTKKIKRLMKSRIAVADGNGEKTTRGFYKLGA